MGLNKPTVVVAGSVTTRSGYGSHARDIVRALINSDKYDVRVVPIRWGNTPQNALNENDQKDKVIIDRFTSFNMNTQPDIFIHITIPNEFQPIGKYNIGLTAGIETTACKKEWVDGCNRMDLVLTTSNHSKQALLGSKYEQRDSKTGKVVNVIQCQRPMEVLFEGIDTEIYRRKKSDGKSKIVSTLNEIEEDFCFLFVGHWLQGELGQDRKDVGMLVKTFLDAFRMKAKRNMPALVLKTSMASFSRSELHEIQDKLNNIRNIVRRGNPKVRIPNVYILHGELSDIEMNELYNHPKIKSMISFTKGEGYGRPLLEFTTTGKPVLASAWSGQLDFLNPDHSILLQGKLTEVHPTAQNDWIINGSKWFTVDYQSALQRMVSVHKDYDKYLSETRKHIKYTKENFSMEAMQEKLCEYIDSIEEYAGKSIQSQPVQNQLKLPKLKEEKATTKFQLPKLKTV